MDSPKKRDRGKALHPLCGLRYPSDDHAWTPALVRQHEDGCLGCQAILDNHGFGRIRNSQEGAYYDQPPFDADE